MLSVLGLECLPNELLLDIFKWLDARALYRGFYRLNARFNRLVQIPTDLHLTFGPCSDEHYDALFASRVHTLLIQCDVLFTLSRYVNVRRLILVNAKREQISQTMIEGAQLEILSLISPRCFYSTFGFHEMIFSNKFPRLTSCHLTNVYSPSLELRRKLWHQSPSLRSLRISSRDTQIHVAILAVCPNLEFLHLSIFQLDRTPCNAQSPTRLKRLKFIFNNPVWPSDETIFDTFFSSMPLLERLSIRRLACVLDTIDDLLAFDWLSRVLNQRLTNLHQLHFRLHLLNTHQTDSADLERWVHQLHKNFVNIYQNARDYSLRVVRL